MALGSQKKSFLRFCPNYNPNHAHMILLVGTYTHTWAVDYGELASILFTAKNVELLGLYPI